MIATAPVPICKRRRLVYHPVPRVMRPLRQGQAREFRYPMMTARALPVEDWPACEECGQPEERDLSEIAADEGLPVATLRAALRVSHPDASAFEVIGLAHRMNAGED